MVDFIDDIITDVCELEGLLLAFKRHGDRLPDATLEAIKFKAGEVARLVNEIPFPEIAEEPIEEPAPVEEEERAPVEEEAPTPIVEEEETAPIEEAPAPTVEEEEVAPIAEVAAPVEEPLRVSDKLHRTLSKDLRRALSLNDRFRFARELFGNDVSKLDHSLAAIEGMNTLEEAEGYLLGDLGLNADDEPVAEFMAIVKNHFL